MAYVLEKFDSISGQQGTIAQQLNQFFRMNPYLTVVAADLQRQQDRVGGQNYSIILTLASNGQRMFAIEFISTQQAFAYAQMNTFFNENQDVVPYYVFDTTSPDRMASGKTRLLLIYSGGAGAQAMACGRYSGIAFSQGTISAGAVGQGERIGYAGNTLELIAVKNLGDASWPTGARGVLLRSRLTCAYGGVGKRTYAGAIPPFSATTTYPSVTIIDLCCGQTLPPVVGITPVANTSSTTATSTGSSSTTTTVTTTTPPPSTPPTLSTTTITTAPTVTTIPGAPPTSPPTDAPSYTFPPNGYCYSEYVSYFDCSTLTWGVPTYVANHCAASLPGTINTWTISGPCQAKGYFTTQSGTGDFNCQVGM